MATCKCCGKELVDICPICRKPVTVYSRPCGYLRPVECWNDGKQQEFKDRAEYTHWANNQDWYDKYSADYTDTCKEHEPKPTNE